MKNKNIQDKFTPPEELSGLPKDTPILVGFSGGADSSALLSMLVEYSKESGAEIYAAHVNHGIRGAEADRDEEFCRARADELGVRIFVCKLDVPALAASEGKSVETAARDARYDFFHQVMRENNIPLLATAHNANDNLETMLFNMTRGCGLGGMCGIPPSRKCPSGTVIRPILYISRPEILEYCEERAIDFVTDSTNTDTDYTRNKIRAEIVPLLEEINSGVVANASRLSESLRADSLCLESMTNWFLSDLSEDMSVECEKVIGSPSAVANRALIALFSEVSGGETLEKVHVDAIRALCEKASPHSSLDLPLGVRAVIENKRLSFLPPSLKKEDEAIVSDYEIELFDGNNPISQTKAEIVIGNSHKEINIYKKSIQFSFDSAKINGTIFARNRRGGDKIRTGGMSKSLKKLFCETKIPLEDRDRIPVLFDSDGIIAVPFVATRDGVRANGETENTICVTVYLY